MRPNSCGMAFCREQPIFPSRDAEEPFEAGCWAEAIVGPEEVIALDPACDAAPDLLAQVSLTKQLEDLYDHAQHSFRDRRWAQALE
jgi:hypothetical protein